MKGPAWVAWRWNHDDYLRGLNVAITRPSFKKDTDLPEYARGGTEFEYSESHMQRGHMCPDNDLESWGKEAVKEGMLMSNVIPQRAFKNHKVWGKLEKQTHDIVASEESDIETIWIIAGPIFSEDENTIKRWGDGNAEPEATYKVVAWKDDEEVLHARAYIINQNDTNLDLTEYLKSVREVQQRSGLDFFHDLPDAQETELEAEPAESLWD